MKSLTSLVLALLVCGSVSSRATLAMWQTQVNTGAVPAATNFTTVLGSAPITFNVGTLSGDRTFEFIVNASAGSAALPSQALLGTQVVANGRQGLKFDQCCNSARYGLTNFGVADFTSTIPSDFGRDVHVVYVSDGATTSLYTDGVFRFTFTTPLIQTGLQGLAAGLNTNGTYFDNVIGSVLGFASYDTALSPAEIATHASAFAAVPEPSTALLAGAVACGLVVARRRRVQA